MTTPTPTHASTSIGSWRDRLRVAARFTVFMYLFAVAALLVATIAPALIAQWQPFAVVSGSMQPTIRPGAMVLVEPSAADRFYDPPTIVVYTDPARPDRIVTHRVVDVAVDDHGSVAYTTQGDANAVADSDRVAHHAVTGHVRMVVPWIGLPANWLHHGHLLALATWVLISLVAVGVLLLGRR